MRKPLQLALLCALVGTAARADAGRIKLTIVAAKIDVKKLAGREAPMSNAHLSDLACLSLPGLRELADYCGAAEKAHPAAAPVDAFALLTIGERTVRTYPVPGTATPKWEYSVVLDKALLAGKGNATLALYDLDGSGTEQKLGEKPIKLAELAKPGTRVVKAIGPGEVTYKIEALPDNGAERSYSFKVPADQQMADLARNAKTSGPGYVVIPVAEGEVVSVTASGKVYPNFKKYPDRVAGPDGIPTIKTKIQYNQPGFRGCPGCDHAALIGQIGTRGLVIGAKKTFTVENSGLLVLAINDLKVVDNAGGFDVSVSVGLPAEAAAPPPPPSEARRAPGGIDPRVVEQIVDSHGDELEACVLKEANPYGEIVLQFSISADGSLLGVIVEKASPNLKAAGECMRKKALNWKFPPPRGVVTARYPLSFSAG
jgi:hypothetical protein